jgi:hypothetical protein
MLEHIPKEKAKELLISLKTKKFRKLIITLPNADFNQFYKLNGEFRHEDHCWEPTFKEAVDFITDVFKEKIKLIKAIGDKINNISVTTMFIIESD